MIQLNDIQGIAINPCNIIYLEVNDNPLALEYKSTINKTGEEVKVVVEVRCVFQHGESLYIQYDCVDVFKSDYQKLLNATNA